MKDNTKYTETQIDNWKKYEKVRARGKYNMFDSAARHATGLSRSDYLFVMDNFSGLREASESLDKMKEFF